MCEDGFIIYYDYSVFPVVRAQHDNYDSLLTGGMPEYYRILILYEYTEFLLIPLIDMV